MEKAVVSIIMGSKSDLETVQPCLAVLDEFGVSYEVTVISAHRQPKRLIKYVEDVSKCGVKVFIAVAGAAAALPGVVASHTVLPVIGVPVQTGSLNGLDSLLSIVQMPGGVPVGCMAIGKSGAKNAGLFAVQILALMDKKIMNKIEDYKKKLSETVVTIETKDA